MRRDIATVAVISAVFAWLPWYASAITIENLTGAQASSGGIHARSGERVLSGDSSASAEINTVVSSGNGSSTVYTRIKMTRNGEKIIATSSKKVGQNVFVRIATSSTSGGSARIPIPQVRQKLQQPNMPRALRDVRAARASSSATAISVALGSSSVNSSTERPHQVSFFSFGNSSSTQSIDIGHFLRNLLNSLWGFVFTL